MKLLLEIEIDELDELKAAVQYRLNLKEPASLDMVKSYLEAAVETTLESVAEDLELHRRGT